MELKDLNIKGLIEKLVAITVIQFIIAGAFILVEPGFFDSIWLYFGIILTVACVLASWLHIKHIKEDIKLASTSVLDETDYAGT